MDQKQEEARPLEPKQIVSRGDGVAFWMLRSFVVIVAGAFPLSESMARPDHLNLLDTSPHFHC